jgi:hypothetical protein
MPGCNSGVAEVRRMTLLGELRAAFQNADIRLSLGSGSPRRRFLFS